MTGIDGRILAILQNYGHTEAQLDKTLRRLHEDVHLYDLPGALSRLTREKRIKVSDKPANEEGRNVPVYLAVGKKPRSAAPVRRVKPPIDDEGDLFGGTLRAPEAKSTGRAD